MRNVTANGATNAMSLDSVIDRLAHHADIDGIMLLGTTGTDRLTPISDLDILLVLNDLPAPMRMVTTWIDGRLAEVYRATVNAIQRIVADGAMWREGQTIIAVGAGYGCGELAMSEGTIADALAFWKGLVTESSH